MENGVLNRVVRALDLLLEDHGFEPVWTIFDTLEQGAIHSLLLVYC